jgi:hypothetical protein
VTEFTLTYDKPDGAPAIQFYEAPESSPSRRYIGVDVAIRKGLTGVYNAALPVLWWVDTSVYFAIQAGGPIPPSLPLAGGASEAELIRMAASATP